MSGRPGVKMPKRSPEHVAKVAASLRARADARRLTLRCDFCLVVTGNVRALMLRGYFTTPSSSARERWSKGVAQGSVLSCQDCWENFGSRCDSCGETWREVGHIRRYSMFAYQRGELGKNNGVMRAAGHMNLCKGCWRKTAGRRTRNRPLDPPQRTKVAA